MVGHSTCCIVKQLFLAEPVLLRRVCWTLAAGKCGPNCPWTLADRHFPTDSRGQTPGVSEKGPLYAHKLDSVFLCCTTLSTCCAVLRCKLLKQLLGCPTPAAVTAVQRMQVWQGVEEAATATAVPTSKGVSCTVFSHIWAARHPVHCNLLFQWLLQTCRC